MAVAYSRISELGVIVHPQAQEVQQVVQVDLPVRLGVGGKRQILAGLFAGDAGFQPLLIDLVGRASGTPLRLR